VCSGRELEEKNKASFIFKDVTSDKTRAIRQPKNLQEKLCCSINGQVQHFEKKSLFTLLFVVFFGGSTL